MKLDIQFARIALSLPENDSDNCLGDVINLIDYKVLSFTLIVSDETTQTI